MDTIMKDKLFIFGLLSYIIGFPSVITLSTLLYTINNFSTYSLMGFLNVLVWYFFGTFKFMLLQMYVLLMLFIYNYRKIKEFYDVTRNLIKLSTKINADQHTTELELELIKSINELLDKYEIFFDTFRIFLSEQLTKVRNKFNTVKESPNYAYVKLAVEGLDFYCSEISLFIYNNLVYTYETIKESRLVRSKTATIVHYSELYNKPTIQPQPNPLNNDSIGHGRVPSNNPMEDLQILNQLMQQFNSFDKGELDKAFLNMLQTDQNMQLNKNTNKKKKKKYK